jgi:hypothetical protein
LANADVYEAKDMLVGELSNKGIVVSRSDNQSFIINSGTYQMFSNSSKQSLSVIFSANISSGTVSGPIKAPLLAGRVYLDFTYYINAEGIAKKARLSFNVV